MYFNFTENKSSVIFDDFPKIFLGVISDNKKIEFFNFEKKFEISIDSKTKKYIR